MHQLTKFVRPIVFVATVAMTIPLCAENIELSDSSLKLIPANAASASVSFQNDVQMQRFLKSNAFKAIKNHPIIQMGWGQAMFMFQNGPASGVNDFFQQPENKDLLPLLKDAVSNEIFSYADESSGEWLEFAVDFSNRMNTLNIKQATGEEVSPASEFAEALISFLEDASAPAGVMGFKTSMGDVATEQLGRLEQFLNAMINNVDDLSFLKGKLSSETIDDNKFLVLELDGSMIPWSQIEDEEIFESFEKVKDTITAKKATISLGVRGGYILLAIGENTEVVKNLGEGATLWDAKELAPLRKQPARPFTSISYVSKDMMQSLASPKKIIDQYASMISMALKSSDMPEELLDSITADIDEFSGDLKALVPEVGSNMSFSFMSDQGYEGFGYNYTKHSQFDGSKPLDILEHVGESPLMLFAGREKNNQAEVELAAKWSKKIFAYADKAIRMKLEEEEDEEGTAQYEKAVKEFTPLLKQVQEVCETKLAPAFADGQSAVVIDAQSKRESWNMMMPPSDDPLPMLELALVIRVSDAKLAKEGYSELFEIAQTAFKKVIEMAPEDKEIPMDELPEPLTDEVDSGVMYSYELPAESGFDAEAVRPNALFADDVLVLSLIPEASERLAEKNDPPSSGVLQRASKPAYFAVHFDFGGFVNVAKDWVDYAASLNDDVAEQMPHIEFVMNLLECFGSVSSVSYPEDGAVVTHFEVKFKDLED